MKTFFDGSGWNGQTSAYTVVFEDKKRPPIIVRLHEKKSNNEMEYAALIEALENANDGDELVGDSQLVERQLSGQYQVKAENLKPLFEKAKALYESKNVSLKWVPREQNKAGQFLERLARQKA
ncbi:reverse transcriptase-like protein [Candidatus Micrarchaeota archaeon]|nr:reverse transcriptase-like protein [Candidatus Micrarchaeota archaeon]